MSWCSPRADCFGSCEEGGGVKSEDGGGGEIYLASCLRVVSALPGVGLGIGVDCSLRRMGSGVGVLGTEMSDMLALRRKDECKVSPDVDEPRRKELRPSGMSQSRSK